MSLAAPQILLPDLFSTLSLKFSTNPWYKEASEESRAWISSYDLIPDRKRVFFFQGVSELLCAHSYPYASRDQLRTVCDFVNLLFVVDEVSDDQSGIDALNTGRIFLNAMADINWDDGSELSNITKDFRSRFAAFAGPNNFRRFIKLCEEYIECVAVEAELREHGQVADLSTYIPLRRNNSAVPLCFSLIEHMLAVDIDDRHYDNTDFVNAYWAACDYVCWSNDLYSYDMEQSKGIHGNNAVSVLMNEYGIGMQEAADMIGAQCAGFADTYISSKQRLAQSLGSHSDAVRFIDALGCWMIGNLHWSFDSLRYFGPRHLEVKETRVVVLRPKEIGGETSPPPSAE